MEWLVKAILETERAYLVCPAKRDLFALGAVRLRYVDGSIAFGGEVLSCDPPSSDGLILQLWTKDENIVELSACDIDVFTDGNSTFFNGVSVPGRTKVLYSSGDDGTVMKSISVSL